MTRIEVISEWFYPQQFRVGGLIIPAQEIVVDKYEELKNTWQKENSNLPKEVPIISLAPGEKDGQPGYYVRTEIMYRG